METWKPMAGYPDYQISDEGNVQYRRRVQNPAPYTPRFEWVTKTQRLDRQGYRVIRICHKPVFVHRLVLESFVGPSPKDKPLALHYDDDKANNRLSNLRWGNASENRRDAIRNNAPS